MWVEPVAERPATCLPLVQLAGQLDSGCATCGADRQLRGRWKGEKPTRSGSCDQVQFAKKGSAVRRREQVCPVLQDGTERVLWVTCSWPTRAKLHTTPGWALQLHPGWSERRHGGQF